MFLDTRLLRLHSSARVDLLVCFPHAGAGISAFLSWPRQFNQLLDIALVQLPGREDRIHEVFSETLMEVSTHIADELASMKPRILFMFGHSMGASIAWAVASQLWHRYGLKPIMILSAQSPCIPIRELNWNPDDLRQWFNRLGEEFPLALDNSEMLDLFQRTFATDWAWMARELSIPPVGSLPVDLYSLYGLQDGLVKRDQAAIWQSYTSAKFVIKPMQGGHLYWLSHPEELFIFIHQLIDGYRASC